MSRGTKLVHQDNGQDNENWGMGQIENKQQGYFLPNHVANPNEEVS